MTVGPKNSKPIRRLTMVQKVPLHKALANALVAHEIDTVFGLLGDANLFMVNALLAEHDVTYVPFVHEAGSVLAALGYARTSGKVGVATVTHGPALTNCTTALVEAARSQLPVVLLAGDTAITAPHNPQNIAQRSVVDATGAGFEQMRSPASATADLARAFYRARVERRPIVLNMPADFMWEDVTNHAQVHAVPYSPSMVPEGAAMEQAIGMLASARRPLLLAGSGAIDGRDAIVTLAERIAAPLATTLQAKDLFRGHANNIGLFGTLSTDGAYDIMSKADVVVVFGGSMHVFNTDHGKLLDGKRVIQVNDTLASIGAMYVPDVVLVADAGLTAADFKRWMDETETPSSQFASEIDRETVLSYAPGEPETRRDGYVDYITALEHFEAVLPKERLLICDGGRFMTEPWCRISVPSPRSFVYSTRFAAIGQGFSQAIGAGHGAPDKLPVAYVGDGGFMLGGLTEFNTAVRAGLKMVCVVANDSAYGAEHIQLTDRQMDPAISTFLWPSFAKVARALGGDGITIRGAEDFDLIEPAVAQTKGPLLIDLKLDPASVPRMRL